MRWFWQARDERVREDTGSGTLEDFYWGRPASGTEEDYLWRRLSDNWYQKDVIPSTYLELHNQCFEAYNANPLAFQVIEITTSMVLGCGVNVVAANRRVQAVIDRFWNDPDNHMSLRIYSLCTELALYGEQFIRFFVNPFDGTVKIGQIDPSTIDEIYSNPENVEQPLRFHQRPLGAGYDVWGPGAGTPPPVVTDRLASEASDGRWFEAGKEVVQYAINRVSNAKRGHSDLATLLPWLRRYKDWLTDRVRLNKYKGAFLWDVKLMGADKKTIDRKRAEYAYPPEPGSIVVSIASRRSSGSSIRTRHSTGGVNVVREAGSARCVGGWRTGRGRVVLRTAVPSDGHAGHVTGACFRRLFRTSSSPWPRRCRHKRAHIALRREPLAADLLSP